MQNIGIPTEMYCLDHLCGALAHCTRLGLCVDGWMDSDKPIGRMFFNGSQRDIVVDIASNRQIGLVVEIPCCSLAVSTRFMKQLRRVFREFGIAVVFRRRHWSEGQVKFEVVCRVVASSAAIQRDIKTQLKDTGTVALKVPSRLIV